MMKLQAVILTGARDSHHVLLAGTTLQNKALLPVGGKPMVVSVLEALAGSGYGPEIYISTQEPEMSKLETSIPFKILPSEANAAQSLLRSLERVSGDGWVLFVSGDHPLLTPDMVDYFLEEAMGRDLTLAMAMVSQKLVEQAYPQSRRTYLKVKDNAYSGGNLFLINKARFMANTAVLEAIEAHRKNPFKAICLMDPISVLQIVFRQLDIHEFAKRASRKIGCEVGVVEMPFAECCMDVDKPSDREIAEVILQQRQPPQSLPPYVASA